MNTFENKDVKQALIDKLTELIQKDGYYITSIEQTRECDNCIDNTIHTIRIGVELKKREIKILDKEEKEYLEAVVKPFKNRVIAINCHALSFDGAYIMIELEKPFDSIDLPRFEKGTMYKGMELNKEYTLEELGLFEE